MLLKDPVIFVGTIRDNLDPFDQYSDQQLWDALELSHLKAFVADLADQLEFQLGEGGTNIRFALLLTLYYEVGFWQRKIQPS